MKVLKLFTSPSTFFEKHFSELKLSTLGIFYAVVLVYFFIVNLLQALILKTGIVAMIITYVGTWLLGFAVFVGLFAIVAKLVINTKNKAFTFNDSLKVILSAYLITYAFQIVTTTLSLVLTFASQGFVNSVSILDSNNLNEAAVGSLATQGILFGGLGLVLACISLVGFVWSLVVEIIGLSKVGKVDMTNGLLAALVANVVAFVANWIIAAIVGVIVSAITVASYSVLY